MLWSAARNVMPRPSEPAGTADFYAFILRLAAGAGSYARTTRLSLAPGCSGTALRHVGATVCPADEFRPAEIKTHAHHLYRRRIPHDHKENAFAVSPGGDTAVDRLPAIE